MLKRLSGRKKQKRSCSVREEWLEHPTFGSGIQRTTNCAIPPALVDSKQYLQIYREYQGFYPLFFWLIFFILLLFATCSFFFYPVLFSLYVLFIFCRLVVFFFCAAALTVSIFKVFRWDTLFVARNMSLIRRYYRRFFHFAKK